MQKLSQRKQFVENQILEIQNMQVQFKNYIYPFTDNQIKKKIKNTIVAFLNTKGGAIYLSIDKNCVVKGISLDIQQKDRYRLQIIQLLDQIDPKVDMINEQIKVHFIPVISKNSIFTGKYVPKIIVKQGKQSQLYTFTEKIFCYDQNKNQKSQIKIMKSYIRYPGNNQKLTINQIKQQIKKRILHPIQQYKFNENQHIQPNDPVKNLNMIIIKCSQQDQQQIIKLSQRYFQQMKIENKVVKTFQELIYIINDQYKVEIIKEKMVKNLENIKLYLNIDLGIPQIQRGAYVFYVNKQNLKDNRQNFDKKEQIFKQQVEQKFSKKNQTNEHKKKQMKQQKKNSQLNRKPQVKSQYQNIKFIFTHIKPSQGKRILLSQLIQNKAKQLEIDIIIYNKYINSIAIYLKNKADYNKFLIEVNKNKYKLNKEFGFHEKLFLGLYQKKILIKNFYLRRCQQFQQYLFQKIKPSPQKIYIEQQGRKVFLVIVLKQVNDGCKILDWLIGNKEIRDQFGLKKEQKKMKFYLKV